MLLGLPRTYCFLNKESRLKIRVQWNRDSDPDV
jgi:hypothetical protein